MGSDRRRRRWPLFSLVPVSFVRPEDSEWPEEGGTVTVNPPEDYPPFSGDEAVCVKCGSDVIDTEYQPEGTRLRGQHVVLGPGPEWLKRECSRCGYSWPETTVSEPRAR